VISASGSPKTKQWKRRERQRLTLVSISRPNRPMAETVKVGGRN
jgi:hypothetical protein